MQWEKNKKTQLLKVLLNNVTFKFNSINQSIEKEFHSSYRQNSMHEKLGDMDLNVCN